MTASQLDSGRPGFLLRITLATGWGNGLDGYDLGGISVVLPLIITQLHTSTAWAGLIGASSLIGIFFGGPIFGYLTDRFGRRLLFTIDLGLFVAAGLLQLFVHSDWQLFVVRVALGVAIGAEYAIGGPILSEFSPTGSRGTRLVLLGVFWYFGYLASVAVGYTLLQVPGTTWQLVLATSVVPALITLLLRFGMPESPRWLMRRGREREARAVFDRFLGGAARFESEELSGEGVRVADMLRLFSPQYRVRALFVCVFWACQVAPYFAIFTFAPVVLQELNVTRPIAGQLMLNGVGVLGCLAATLAIERVGRRRLVIVPFWVMTGALAVVAVFAHGPPGVVVVAFMLFSLFNAASSPLSTVYPNELFPTDLRGSAVGLGSAASRVSAAVGTFLLPVGLSTLGVGPTILVAAGCCALGAVVSHLWAPETTGLTLTRAARPLPASAR